MLQIQDKTHIFTGQVSIRWRDIDPFGMVNHSIYFTLMEEVRWKWFETTNIKSNYQLIYPITEAHILFKNKIAHPAEITIHLYTGNFSEKSWVFYHEIFNTHHTKEVHAEASITSITYDPKNKLSVPIPSGLKDTLSKKFNI